MLIQNFKHLFPPGGLTLNSNADDLLVLESQILGIDTIDVKQRAESENFEAYKPFYAAWAIILSRHTSYNSIEFMSSVESKSKDVGLVTVRIEEEQTFSDLMASGFDFPKPSCMPPAEQGLTQLMVYPEPTTERTVFALPKSSQSLLAIQLWSSRSKELNAKCTFHRCLPRFYIQTIMDHTLHVLRHMVNQMAWKSFLIRDLSMLSFKEETHLRQQSSPVRCISDTITGSVHQLFRLQARKTPHSPALEGPRGVLLSYKELDHVSDLMAVELQQGLSSVPAQSFDTGVSHNHAVVVGIMLRRSPNVVISILSCWKAGFAIVLLDPNQPSTRNNHIIQDCRCALLLVDETHNSNIQNPKEMKYDFSYLLKRSKGLAPRHDEIQIDLQDKFLSPAWFRTTSGSTNRPKCALFNHATLGASISSFTGRLRGKKTLLFFSPISSAAGNSIWSHLTNGQCVCIPSQSELDSDLAACINKYGADDICITSSAIKSITPDQVLGLKSIALVGEATPSSVCDLWSRHAAVLTGYGATEMNSHARPFHDEPGGCLPPALAIPNSDYSLYVLQQGTTKPCGFYAPGEICLSSTHMSVGYVGEVEMTSQVFIPHPFPGDAGHTILYRTGDIGMLVGDRRFVVLGRMDTQFKIDGNRVQPEEIESVVRHVPKVHQCKVLRVKTSIGRSLSVCCIILNKTLKRERTAKTRWEEFVRAAKIACKAQLPSFMIPHRWLQFEKFPETATSKTDLKTLAELVEYALGEEELKSPDRKGRPRKNRISSVGRIFLTECTAALTGSPGHLDRGLSISAHNAIERQSFIANGGSSLTAIRLKSKLNAHGIEVPLAKLYSEQSLLQIAQDLTICPIPQESRCNPKDELPGSMVDPLLLHLLKEPGFEYDQFESLFPATMFQQDMVAVSMMAPKSWVIYQFLELSSIDCTFTQLNEAMSLMVSTKRVLRTTFLRMGERNGRSRAKDPKEISDIIRNGGTIQAILRYEEGSVSMAQLDHIESTEQFWRQDCNSPWTLGKPFWRVAFLSKPRILALTLHHAIVDHWVGLNISKDLHGILTAIIERDEARPGWHSTMATALGRSTRDSMESWAINHYGPLYANERVNSAVQKHTKIWEEFMSGAEATPIPDDFQLPYERLPTPPFAQSLESVAYGEWCTRHHVPAASLFHAVNALTIARVSNWWSSEGPKKLPGEIVYYRMSSNRYTTPIAPGLEGNISSINPIRVRVAANSDIVMVAKSALHNWLSTHESDPYYVDPQPMPSGKEPMDKRRRWGNVLLNHIIHHNNQEADDLPSFKRSVGLEDGNVFAMVWAFGALEMTVVENNSGAANSLNLAVLTSLDRKCAEDYMEEFTRILHLVLRTECRLTVQEMVQK